MANNPYPNKVQFGNQTIMDITPTTAVASDVAEGKYFFTASGQLTLGTLQGGGGTAIIRDTTDSAGGTIREIVTDEELYLDDLSVTQNGTYNAPSGTAYDSVSVNVQASPSLQTKTATYTPTESQQTATITADSGYDGLEEVDVTVNAISNTYVGSGITRRSSTDLTVSGATVTAPSGYYSESASKSVSTMTLPTSASTTRSYTSKATVGRSTSAQYINIPTGYNSTGASYTISATPNGIVTAPSSISGTSATVSTGTNTLMLTKSVSVTPSVTTAGYVSSGTAGNSSVSLTANVTTQGATTITPSTSQQTAVSSGTYVTGNVVVSAMPTMTLPSAPDSTSSGTSKGTITRSTSTRYLNIPTGYNSTAQYYTISAVANGTEGTPTATKGTVSNHSVSVTPSVTNSAGYITGSTKTGTAVTVTASELASGNKEITSNGTNIDVVGYSTVSVDVESGYSETLIKNFIERSTSFTSFDFPNGLTKIGDYAFANCTQLASTSLPSGITSISKYAFYNCTVLALTSLPSGLKTISDYAFANCRTLALTSLPSGITSIGTNALSNCTQLALTSLPSGLKTISNYAFEFCPALALTSLPSGITSIGTTAFAGCTSLALTSLPSGITSIGTYAFQYCAGLTSISCTGIITSLGSGAFFGDASRPMQLVSVMFPNMTISSLTTVFGSASVSYACKELEVADIGETLGIGANAFANCYKLQTLVLRKTDAVTTLANISAFLNTPMRGYNSLTGTVYVPNALISSYQSANNWSTLYNNGTITFKKIEDSAYDLS